MGRRDQRNLRNKARVKAKSSGKQPAHAQPLHAMVLHPPRYASLIGRRLRYHVSRNHLRTKRRGPSKSEKHHQPQKAPAPTESAATIGFYSSPPNAAPPYLFIHNKPFTTNPKSFARRVYCRDSLQSDAVAINDNSDTPVRNRHNGGQSEY